MLSGTLPEQRPLRLPVVGEILGNSEQSPIVSLYEFLKRTYIAILVACTSAKSSHDSYIAACVVSGLTCVILSSTLISVLTPTCI